jgi:Kef-type K+ transport system membrane component KefB
MVGILLFGVALGPHVLGFFGEHRPIANFFAELGKLLLMFSAGLEIDIALFRKAQARSITFGLLTTSVPLLFGTLLGLSFGYTLIPAIIVGSLARLWDQMNLRHRRNIAVGTNCILIWTEYLTFRASQNRCI